MASDWYGTPMTPLTGGYSGETFAVGEWPDALVLRIYRRQPERAAIDASLLRLMRGIIAVPRVVDVRVGTETTPAVVVTERLRGVALDQLLRDDPDHLDLEQIAHDLADILAALSGVPFLHPGVFADASLAVSRAGLPTDLAEWAQLHRDTTRLATWSERDWEALLRLVDQAEDLLDPDAVSTPPRTVLVHSDFNPKNLLADPLTSRIVGLVDWEFAHAGSVYTDIGNLTRFERDDRLLVPVLDRLTEKAPGGLREPFLRGRAADLWALVELAGKAGGHAVGQLATTLLLAQARTGDLTAWPWSARRVDPTGAGVVS